MAGNRFFLAIQREKLPEAARLLHIHGEEIADRASAELHVRRLRLQPRSMALRARLVAAVLRQLHADVDLVLLRLQPLEEALDSVPLPAAVVEKVPLRGRELLDRDVEAQLVFLLRLL